MLRDEPRQCMDARHDLAKRQAAVTRDQRSLVLEGCGGLGHQIDHTTDACCGLRVARMHGPQRSEEHTSELQSLMRISYAVFCLKKKKITPHLHYDKLDS